MDRILPKRLETERPYGQFGYSTERKSKNAYANVSEINASTDFHIPQSSIYGSCDEHTEARPTSLDVLTVVGIMPSQRHLLERYFNQFGYKPEILMSERGNWAYLKFNKNKSKKNENI